MDQGNKLLLLASITLVTVSGFSVWVSLWWLGSICIVIAEIYLVAVLALAAYRSDKVSRGSNYEVPNWMNNVFPTMLVGCFVVISLLLGYRGCGDQDEFGVSDYAYDWNPKPRDFLHSF